MITFIYLFIIMHISTKLLKLHYISRKTKNKARNSSSSLVSPPWLSACRLWQGPGEEEEVPLLIEIADTVGVVIICATNESVAV